MDSGVETTPPASTMHPPPGLMDLVVLRLPSTVLPQPHADLVVVLLLPEMEYLPHNTALLQLQADLAHHLSVAMAVFLQVPGVLEERPQTNMVHLLLLVATELLLQHSTVLLQVRDDSAVNLLTNTRLVGMVAPPLPSMELHQRTVDSVVLLQPTVDSVAICLPDTALHQAQTNLEVPMGCLDHMLQTVDTSTLEYAAEDKTTTSL